MATVDEDEYEYEYSSTETETFLVDLDLSSVNGFLKSINSGDRKTLKAPQQLTSKDPKPGENPPAQEADNEADEEHDAISPAPDEQVSRAPGTPENNNDITDEFGENIQILDLHTRNPLVSYRNNIYSCTWTDMIGTSMFFTKHQDTPLHEPEIATEDYDLLGTSRVKLVGHRANIAPKPESRKRPYTDDATADIDENSAERYVPAGRSLGGIKRTNPKTNADIKQQASFLERLMDIKKSRGDPDTVRTFVDRFTIAAESKRKEELAETQKEIESLNRRVVQGDNDALERLQDIYSHMEEVNSDED